MFHPGITRRLSLAAMGAAALMFAVTALSDDDAKTKGDIITVAQAAGKFNTFLKLVDAAGLTDKLKSGHFTVLAPTDDAFAKLAPGELNDLLQPANKEKLVGLVQYHIVPRTLPASMFGKTTSQMHDVKALNNRMLKFQQTSNEVKVNDVVVEEHDYVATNGYLHALDGVLTPPPP